HYLTERQDTPFWQRFSLESTMPSLREKLELWRRMPLFDDDNIQLDMFKPPSWIAVGHGLRLFDRDAFRRLAARYNQDFVNARMQALISKQRHVGRACLLHTDFLAFLREH